MVIMSMGQNDKFDVGRIDFILSEKPVKLMNVPFHSGINQYRIFTIQNKYSIGIPNSFPADDKICHF